MRTLFLAVIACLVLFRPAAAAERYVAQQTARVSVGTDGRIGRLDWVGATLSPQMLDTLAARVRKVEFEPARVDGVPAEAETTLLVRLEAKAVDSGLALHIYGVEVTAGLDAAKPPRYPFGKLRDGKTAKIVLRIDFDGTGRVIEVQPSDPAAPRDDFLREAMKAAKRWTVRPERVAGVGVPGSAIVPVHFSIVGERQPGAPQGDLEFRDGGVLRVYREDSPDLEQPKTLADSRVRLRSIDGALDGDS